MKDDYPTAKDLHEYEYNMKCKDIAGVSREH